MEGGTLLCSVSVTVSRFDEKKWSVLSLLSILPRVKPSTYHLRNKKNCYKPKINTTRFKNSFINRLVYVLDFNSYILLFILFS